MNIGSRRFRKDLFGDQYYKTLAERDAHPLFARKPVVQLFYVTDEDKTYHLVEGYTNEHWKEHKLHQKDKKDEGGQISIPDTGIISISYPELLALLSSNKLDVGRRYSYDYVCVYRDPVDNTVVTKTATPETFIVEAISGNKLSGEARSLQYPLDIILLDIAVQTNGSRGHVKYRRDEKGNEAHYDWRNVTFRRWNITGILHAQGNMIEGSTKDMEVTNSIPPAFNPANLDYQNYPVAYYEFYAILPIIHDASPHLTVRMGTSMVGTTPVTHTAPLLNNFGNPLAANGIRSISSTGHVLIHWSEELKSFIIVQSASYNRAVQGYYAPKPTNFTIGHNMILEVDATAVRELYTFGRRDAICKNCRIGQHITKALPNVILYYADATSNEITVLPDSENSTISGQLSHASTAITPMSQISGKFVNSILRGRNSEMRFEGGLVSSFINNNGSGSNLPLSMASIPGTGKRARIESSTIMLGNAPSPQVGDGIHRNALSIQFGYWSQCVVRAMNLAQYNLTLAMEFGHRSYFNISKDWFQVYLQNAEHKSYEWGASRIFFNCFGRYGNPESFRDSLRELNYQADAAHTVLLQSHVTGDKNNFKARFLTKGLSVETFNTANITLEGGLEDVLYKFQIKQTGTNYHTTTFTNLLNPPVLPVTVYKKYLLRIRKVGQAYICESWLEVPNNLEVMVAPPLGQNVPAVM